MHIFFCPITGFPSTPQPPLNRRQRWRVAKRQRQMCDAGEPKEFVVSLSHKKYCHAWRQGQQQKQEKEWQRKDGSPVKEALDALSRQLSALVRALYAWCLFW